jgi:hypothetical protein
VYLVFWTLSYLTFSSMSNLPRLLIPFGLQHTLTPLQHPIHRACSSLLDFLMPSRSFNVQSAALAHPFWTSAYLNSASTSNPPCLLIPFGLPRAVSPLQRPIHRACSSLLDFLVPYLRFNVQFTVYPPPPQKGVEFFAPVGAKPRSTGPRAPLSKNPATPCFIH